MRRCGHAGITLQDQDPVARCRSPVAVGPALEALANGVEIDGVIAPVPGLCSRIDAANVDGRFLRHGLLGGKLAQIYGEIKESQTGAQSGRDPHQPAPVGRLATGSGQTSGKEGPDHDQSQHAPGRRVGRQAKVAEHFQTNQTARKYSRRLTLPARPETSCQSSASIVPASTRPTAPKSKVFRVR
jgi:hypothetical protein